MSTDWYVYCMDCDDTHHFNNANHKEKMIWVLIHNCEAIANITELNNNPEIDLEFRLSPYGRINPDWFSRHKYHKLVPINEYGGFNSELCDYCRIQKETQRIRFGNEEIGFFCRECCRILSKNVKSLALVASVINS